MDEFAGRAYIFRFDDECVSQGLQLLPNLMVPIQIGTSTPMPLTVSLASWTNSPCMTGIMAMIK
jgi:hypothetical protein